MSTLQAQRSSIAPSTIGTRKAGNWKQLSKNSRSPTVIHAPTRNLDLNSGSTRTKRGVKSKLATGNMLRACKGHRMGPVLLSQINVVTGFSPAGHVYQTRACGATHHSAS